MLRRLMMISVVIFLGVQHLGANDMRKLQHSTRPFYYYVKGELKGVAVDTIKKISAISGVPIDMNKYLMMHWKNAYETALKTPGMIMVVGGSQKAKWENDFQWIGPFYHGRAGIFIKKGAGVEFDDIRKVAIYKTASARASFPEKMFIKNGGDISKVLQLSTTKQIFRMLDMGRVDAVVTGELTFLTYMHEHHINSSLYEMPLVLSGADIYFALPKSMETHKVQKLHDALETIKHVNPTTKTSVLGTIFANYLPEGQLAENMIQSVGIK